MRSSSWHYNILNPFGCPGAQMNGAGEWINDRSYCRTIFNLMLLQTYRVFLLVGADSQASPVLS